MLQREKIRNDLVAVSNSPTEILLRPSGKKYYEQELPLVQLNSETLKINLDTAKKFNISIEFCKNGKTEKYTDKEELS